jgi:Fatty acid hydroxylase superfamily.
MISYWENLLILVSTPLYVLIILGEILLSNYRHKPVYSVKDTLTNAYMMLLNAGIDVLFRSVYLLVLVYVFKHRFGQISNPLVYWLVLLIAEDFIFYWLHRLEHTVRMFWVRACYPSFF